jgi:hypothetical protein
VVPQELARCFYEKPIFLVRTPADLGRLLPLLRAHGETRVLRIDAGPAPANADAPAAANAPSPANGSPGGTPFTDELAFMTYRLSAIDLP